MLIVLYRFICYEVNNIYFNSLQSCYKYRPVLYIVSIVFIAYLWYIIDHGWMLDQIIDQWYGWMYEIIDQRYGLMNER